MLIQKQFMSTWSQFNTRKHPRSKVARSPFCVRKENNTNWFEQMMHHPAIIYNLHSTIFETSFWISPVVYMQQLCIFTYFEQCLDRSCRWWCIICTIGFASFVFWAFWWKTVHIHSVKLQNPFRELYSAWRTDTQTHEHTQIWGSPTQKALRAIINTRLGWKIIREISVSFESIWVGLGVPLRPCP